MLEKVFINRYFAYFSCGEERNLYVLSVDYATSTFSFRMLLYYITVFVETKNDKYTDWSFTFWLMKWNLWQNNELAPLCTAGNCKSKLTTIFPWFPALEDRSMLCARSTLLSLFVRKFSYRLPACHLISIVIPIFHMKWIDRIWHLFVVFISNPSKLLFQERQHWK